MLTLPTLEDEADQHVVRGSMARSDNLVAGTAEHRLVAGLTGFSAQSAPRLSIEELARGGRFRNRQISVTTLKVLQRHGFAVVFPTPGRGAYHATVRVPYPLPPDTAALLAGLFVQCPKPRPVP